MVISIVVGALGTVPKGLRKKTKRIRNQRNDQGHSN